MKVKGINYQFKNQMLYCILASIIVGLLAVANILDTKELFNSMQSLIHMIMLILFVYNFDKTFSMKGLYNHIIPISKRKIFLDMSITWIVVYFISLIIEYGFLAIQIDIVKFINNVDIGKFLLATLVTSLSPIFLALILVFLIMLNKIFNIKIIFIVIGVLIIVRLLPIFDFNQSFSYRNNIDMYKLKSQTVVLTIKESKESDILKLKKESGEGNFEYHSDLKDKETYFYYPELVQGIFLIILGIPCLRNIERYNIEEEVIVRNRRRALYEKRWYDKWI